MLILSRRRKFALLSDIGARERAKEEKMNLTNESEYETQRQNSESRMLAERNRLSSQRVCRQNTSRVQLFSILCNLWNELNPENHTDRAVSRKNVQSNGYKKKIHKINNIHKNFTLIQSVPNKRNTRFNKYKENLIDS